MKLLSGENKMSLIKGTPQTESIEIAVELPFYCQRCRFAINIETKQYLCYRNNSPKGSRLAIVMAETNKMCNICFGWMKLVQ